MGFVLHSKTCDALTPSHPCLETADGYAWHDAAAKQRCLQGFLVGVGAQLASQAISGEPVDRLLALLELWTLSKAAFRRMYPSECDGCGRNHSKSGLRLLRGARAIHPEAVPALRDAHVSLESLMLVTLPPDSPRLLGGRPRADPRKHKKPRWGLPVGCTPEESRLKQLVFAAETKVRNSYSLAELALEARTMRAAGADAAAGVADWAERARS